MPDLLVFIPACDIRVIPEWYLMVDISDISSK